MRPPQAKPMCRTQTPGRTRAENKKIIYSQFEKRKGKSSYL